MASVIITYMKEGTKPPIYLAGSFSGWEAQEMEYEKPEGQEELRFYKKIEGPEGAEFQYKFRIGPGDWWVLDESAPVVTDNLGNRNNLLVMPTESASKMSEHGGEKIPGDELTAMHSPGDSEKASADKDSKQNEVTTQEEAGTTEVAETMNEKKDSEEAPENAATSESQPTEIPTLIVQKTDDLPSYGDDFGASATVAEKDAHAMRAADAEPDLVVIQDEEPSEEAKTTQEVAESAALLDEREKTPDIPDEEAGKIGLRRLSTTPIPVVASIAAEVAESAALLDERAGTPEISDAEAGKAGLRRMSTTPIGEVADTAAEVAEVAANLDQEMPSTPASTNGKPEFIDLRRVSLSSKEFQPPKSPAEYAAEAASIAEGAKHIDEPAVFDDDDGKEYPVTPADEKAPLLPHEMYISSSRASPPGSDIPQDHPSDSPAITPFDERVGLFPHERYIDPEVNNSPRREAALPSPAEHQMFNIQDFPNTREGIMALLDRTQRDLPPDEIRLTSPSSPTSPSMYDRGDVLTPGQSPRSDQRNSPRVDPRAMSLDSIAEENDTLATDEGRNGNGASPLGKDDGNLTAIQYAHISEMLENPAAPEQTLKSLGVEHLKDEAREKAEKDAAQPRKDSAKDLEGENGVGEPAEEIVVEGVVLPDQKQEFVPLGHESSGQKLDEASAELVDKVVEETNKDNDSIKQMDGKADQMNPTASSSEVIEVVDDGASSDSPKTTPPTSSDGDHVSNQAHGNDGGNENEAVDDNSGVEVHNDKSTAEGLDAPSIVVHPATPAVRDAFPKEMAGEEAHASAPKSTPIPDEVKTHIHTQEGDTVVTVNKADEDIPSAESNTKSSPIPEETKTHLHTQEGDTVSSHRTINSDGAASDHLDPDNSVLAENTVIHRKPSGSVQRSESPDSARSSEPLLPKNGNEKQGFMAKLFGWIARFFAGLCGDGGRAKGKKKGGQRV